MAEEQLQLDDNRLQQEVARSRIAAMPLHNFINVLRGRYHFSTPSICASLVVVNADNLPVSEQEQGLTTATGKRDIALQKSDDPAIIEKDEKDITEKALYFKSLEIQRAKDPTLGQSIYKTLQKKDITPQEIQEVNRSLISVSIAIPQPLHDAIMTRQATSSTILFSPEENLIMNTAIETNRKSKKQISQQIHNAIEERHQNDMHHIVGSPQTLEAMAHTDEITSNPHYAPIKNILEEKGLYPDYEEATQQGDHAKQIKLLSRLDDVNTSAPQTGLIAAAGATAAMNVPQDFSGIGMKLPNRAKSPFKKNKGMNEQPKKTEGAGAQQPPASPQQPQQTQVTQEERATDEVSGEQTTTTTIPQKPLFNGVVKSAVGVVVGASVVGGAGFGALATWFATQPNQNPDVPKTGYIILKSIGVIFSRFFS